MRQAIDQAKKQPPSKAPAAQPKAQQLALAPAGDAPVRKKPGPKPKQPQGPGGHEYAGPAGPRARLKHIPWTEHGRGPGKLVLRRLAPHH